MSNSINLPICNAIALDNVNDLFLYISPQCTGENTINLGLLLYSKRKAKMIDKHFTTAILREDGLIRLNLPPKRHVAEVIGSGFAAWIESDGPDKAKIHIEQGYRFEDFKLEGIVPHNVKTHFPEH